MLKLLADRIQHPTGEIDNLNKRIAAGLKAHFPGLLDTHGVGPDSAALYRIVLSRLRWDDRTQDYLRRRLFEGRTRREITRCLRRYVAREIYPLIGPTRSAVCHADPSRTAS
ncbi:MULTISPECIES: hypothetical protein [Streptomyces]|uniref:hypothetical protein n=1 Tax=Streptomyces lycopersici TaxID=2974589 RepID=UPI0021D03123|nr:hypothetical protein [Streptomyces sp. NEAU-383]